MPDLGVRKPGRHLSHAYGSLHCLSPGARLLVTEEGHRRRLAGTMACLAMLLQNRQDIPVESYRCSILRRQHTRKNCPHYQQASEHEPSSSELEASIVSCHG